MKKKLRLGSIDSVFSNHLEAFHYVSNCS